MAYQEIVIEVEQEQAETLSDILMELGALSVSVEDADADSPDEQPLFGEPGMEPQQLAWNHSRVIALLGEDAPAPTTLLEAASQQLGWGPLPAYHVRRVEEQDWVRLTQAQFEPIAIGRRIWVVPSWHENPPAASDAPAVLLKLDPGLAFGTGSHPTTRLCMEWLETHLHPNENVLDYGCGSGILAIVASKLGAHTVTGVDIDTAAVEAARYNAQRNQVVANFILPDALPAGQYDLVVANILSNPLKLMAAMLAGRVRPGGRLILSGVLARQAEEVAEAYAPWLMMRVWRSHEGWVCLHGTLHAEGTLKPLMHLE